MVGDIQHVFESRQQPKVRGDKLQKIKSAQTQEISQRAAPRPAAYASRYAESPGRNGNDDRQPNCPEELFHRLVITRASR